MALIGVGLLEYDVSRAQVYIRAQVLRRFGAEDSESTSSAIDRCPLWSFLHN